MTLNHRIASIAAESAIGFLAATVAIRAFRWLMDGEFSHGYHHGCIDTDAAMKAETVTATEPSPS